MSKNIVIQEGGLGKQLSADKLKTALVGGGTCLWVPEDSVALIDKTITQNGKYYASSDGANGFRLVTVNIHGKDGDGDEAVPEVGPGGDITLKKVPSAIEITTPPTLLSYHVGDLIDFSGMVVKAKLATGSVFTDTDYPDGIIPSSQLIYPVTEAPDPGIYPTFTTPADDSSDVYKYAGKTFTFCKVPVGIVFNGNSYNASRELYRTWTLTQADGPVFAYRYVAGGYSYIVITSTQSFMLHYYEPNGTKEFPSDYNKDYSITANNYMPISCLEDQNAFISTGDVISEDYYVARDMRKFGTGQGELKAAIPVEWISPYTNETFEDSFEITVISGGE